MTEMNVATGPAKVASGSHEASAHVRSKQASSQSGGRSGNPFIVANTDQAAATHAQTAALRSQGDANIPFALVASGKRLVNGAAAANT